MLVQPKIKVANSTRTQVRDERREYVTKYPTQTILMDLAWKHRVGLLASGYPVLALIGLAWFVHG